MADIFVDSAATGAADGTTWADAYVLIETAVTAATNADRILVADTHAGTKAGPSLIYTCPTTQGLEILGVTPSGASGFTGLNAGAVETATTASDPVHFNGFAYIEGIKFQPGTGGGGAVMILGNSSTVASCLVFKNCHFDQRGNNAVNDIKLGALGGGALKDIYVRLEDCEVSFGQVSQVLLLQSGHFEIVNLTLSGATVPTNLIQFQTTECGNLLFEASDLTGLAITGALLVYAADYNGSLIFRNLKIPSGMSLTSGTPLDPAMEAEFWNVSNAGAPYEVFYDRFSGTVEDDTSVTRTASDGTTAISHLYTPSTDASYSLPLYGPWLYIWNDGTSSITPTVHCLVNTAAAVTSDQVGVDWHHMQAGPNAAVVTTNDGDIVTAGTTLTDISGSDAANWVGESATNLKIFAFAPTFTPGQKGVVRARPWVRVPSGTLSQAYFSAKIVVS